MTFLAGAGGGGSEFSRSGGGLSFLGLSFPDLLGGGGVFGSEFSRFGSSSFQIWEFLKHPCMDCIARQKHKSTLEGSWHH